MDIRQKDFKVLIADENITYRNNLASRLRITGYVVEFATGGFHLLHLLEKFRDYNLIILHESMADMPAEEIISLIRINKNKSELPLIYIAGGPTKEESEIMEIIKSGANEFVVKSNNFQPLVDRVEKYFNVLKNS